MKLATLVLSLAVLVPGCAATTSALGALTGGKAPQVTVINQVAPPASPREPVHAGPGRAMVDGGVLGAVAGGLAGAWGAATPGSVASGVLIGAGVGTALGYVVHDAID